MGREVKRVSESFQWPMNKVWDGFVNPHCEHRRKCCHCDGSGYSKRAKELSELWYGNGDWGATPFDPASKGSAPLDASHPAIAKLAMKNAIYCAQGATAGPAFDRELAAEQRRLCDNFNGQWSHHLNQAEVDALVAGGRLMDFTCDWIKGKGWVEKPAGTPRPTAAEVNSWSLQGMGHDGINQRIVVRHACEVEGGEISCLACQGDGRVWDSEEAKAASEAWEPTEPAPGALWQVWETTSEGSPISPAMADPQELARWMSRNRDGSIDKGTTEQQWLSFILGPGWAPSMLMSGGRVLSGVAGVDCGSE